MSKLLKESWNYYKVWMKESSYSPALKSEIKITRLAWDHIVRGNKSSPRSFKDKARRLNILKSVRYIILNCKDLSKTTKEGFVYYELKQTIKKDKIKVIIREDQKGNKVLYSWMKK